MRGYFNPSLLFCNGQYSIYISQGKKVIELNCLGNEVLTSNILVYKFIPIRSNNVMYNRSFSKALCNSFQHNHDRNTLSYTRSTLFILQKLRTASLIGNYQTKLKLTACQKINSNGWKTFFHTYNKDS